MFATFWNNTVKKKSNAGYGKEPVYKLVTDEQGYRTLQIVGQKDIYAQIQASKDSCDINLILERFARGDESALSRLQGIYGDFTEVPTTLAELQQRVLDAEAMFNSLPLETRAEFEYNPSIFFASIGTEKFNKAIGIKSESLPDIKLPEDGTPIINKPIEKSAEGGAENE